jgi:hypothetical protein
MCRLEARDPGFRSLQQRREMRDFQEAACRAAANPERLVGWLDGLITGITYVHLYARLLMNLPCVPQVTYTQELGRFYMWAQTSASVFIVCHVPTGGDTHAFAVETLELLV